MAKGAEGEPVAYLFHVFFSAVSVCGPGWRLKTVLITFIIIYVGKYPTFRNT